MSNYLSPLNTKLDANQVLRRAYDEPNNRLRVDALVTATIGTVSVLIDAASGDNISISDGTHTLEINPDGSINVVATDLDIRNLTFLQDKVDVSGSSISILDNKTLVNTYASVSSIASGALTTILTKNVSVPSKLMFCSASGENIAKYDILLNGNVLSSSRTYFGNSLNVNFNFDKGISLINGDVVTVRVIHNRPSPGDFNANVLILEG
jgi:hypothetical protein